MTMPFTSEIYLEVTHCSTSPSMLMISSFSQRPNRKSRQSRHPCTTSST
ncbi:hypothetical protein PhCBS80983_g06389 [Powellomyces hirtus]|uniref:Uncharacterized protein n=1 Tax=Powellomyces hirtus TaxID=109895 RepID=A0A507DNJ7_9FUNG|nr:hypothetical protein PhCBS80983_g06389 [Powellomyces hirtus]